MNNTVTTFIDKTDTALTIRKIKIKIMFFLNWIKFRKSLKICNGNNTDYCAFT